jgi:hypothetical protein
MQHSEELFVEVLGHHRHSTARDVEVDSSAQEPTDFAFEIESKDIGGSGHTACSADGANDRVLLWQFSAQVIANVHHIFLCRQTTSQLCFSSNIISFWVCFSTGYQADKTKTCLQCPRPIIQF